LRGGLDRVPGCAEGRGVGQVELADLLDGHGVEQGGGVDVDAFGGFGASGADELSAEELARSGVAGDADGVVAAPG
jgi:hypothetical protein